MRIFTETRLVSTSNMAALTMQPPQIIHDPTIKEYVEEATAAKKIGLIKFGLMSGVDVMKLSHIQIVNNILYQHPTRNPMPYGKLFSIVTLRSRSN